MAKSKSSRPREKDGQASGHAGDDDPKFRLRPPSARAATKGDMGWSIALRTVFRYAKTSAKSRSGRRRESAKATVVRSYSQRCAVRVTYSQNKTAGQWRAHGIYIARESASGSVEAGFEADRSGTDIASRLGSWQNQQDERIWKVILSPEFGERVDLEQMTREVMRRSERQLGTALEWVAVTHFNTEHPHVHLVIRGRRDDGSPLRLPRDFVKQGVRSLAADACTLQLGPRTELDAAAAEEREVRERRYTSLDRALEKRAASVTVDESQQIRILLNLSATLGNFTTARRERHLQARLVVLQSMGLARQEGQHEWTVRSDLSTVLRAMQLASDRQRMLAANGTLLSDERLRLNVLDFRRTPEAQGRVLVHGEEEQASGMGRHYLLLEGTDAQVHMIFYTPEMEIARSAGQLKANSFVRLRSQGLADRRKLEVESLGEAEALLKNNAFLKSTALRLIRRGMIPTDEGWGGWLGKYQAALCTAAINLDLGTQPDRER